MAAGVARAREHEQQPRKPVQWGIIITIALQVLIGSMAFARLQQKVDDLRDELQDVKQQIILLREGK